MGQNVAKRSPAFLWGPYILLWEFKGVRASCLASAVSLLRTGGGIRALGKSPCFALDVRVWGQMPEMVEICAIECQMAHFREILIPDE